MNHCMYDYFVNEESFKIHFLSKEIRGWIGLGLYLNIFGCVVNF